MDKLVWRKRVCALVLLSAVMATVSPAQKFTTLVTFSGPNGAQPSGRLEQGFDGNFYGITAQGGAYSCFPAGCGTIFQVTREGTLKTLLSFSGNDGAGPSGGLTLATDGNFYGTTSGGSYPYLSGSVFRVTLPGQLTTLFGFNYDNGAYPSMPLVEAANGGFYGSTTTGNGLGGTIFVITPGGSLTTLYEFGPDYGWCDSLVQTPDGNFYGTTAEGGANRIGSVFKMTPQGTLTTLYNFGDAGGNSPVALVEAPDGNFYGTTTYGPGAGVGNGTVFKITPEGNLTTLHTFNTAEGYRPGGLLLASDGNFYGITTAGGTNGLGSIYRITPQGAMTTVHSFDVADGGAAPSAALFQATDGKFYGVTSGYSGFNLVGTLFSLSMGLGPFVKTLPHFGEPGGVVKLLGTDLEGATTISFNGTAAAFKVVSPTEILTRVPAGATSGKIQVTTPRGALFSAGPFVVRP